MRHNQTEIFKKFYASKEWKATRLHMLSVNPFCARCKSNGVIKEGTDVHHITDLINDWSLRLTLTNLMTLCHECHSLHTVNEMWNKIKKHNNKELDILKEIAGL